MANINKNGSSMSLPMNIKRGNAIPIDTTLVWYNLTELQSYATSGATAYVGQILTLVDEENSTVSAYVISNEAGTLMKLATTTQSGDLAGDVATLQSQVATLIERVAELGDVSNLDEIAEANLSQDLQDKIATFATRGTTLAHYGITDAYTKTEIDGKLSGALHFKGSVNYYTALTSMSDQNNGDVYLVKYTGTEGTTALNAEYVWTGEAWEELGPIIDLSGYETTQNATAQYNNMQKAIGGLSAEIISINDKNTGILAKAKAYTDTKDTAMGQRVDGVVSDINAINNESTGILITAKNYTDEKTSDVLSQAKSYAEGVANTAETNAKSYTDGKNSAMDTRVQALETNIEKKIDKMTVATDSNLGLVKSAPSSDKTKNKVTVSDEGIMSVSKISGDTVEGAVPSADKLATARNINVKGAVTGSASFDGSADIDINVSLPTVGTEGTYVKVTTDAQGRVVSGETKIATTDIDGAGDIITHNSAEYATASQGALADSALQEITIAGITVNKDTDAAATNKDALKAQLNFADTTDSNTFTGTKNTFNNEVEVKGSITIPDLRTVAATDNSAANKGYVDEQIAKKISASDAMVYRGTIGTDGTITELPTTNVITGDTYKVITDGTYAGQAAFVGDLFIAVVTTTTIAEGESTSIEWTYIPSGNDGNVSAQSDELLNAGNLIIGNGNHEIKALTNGTVGQIIKINEAGVPGYADEFKVANDSSDNSITVSKTTSGSTDSYDFTIANVTVDKLSNSTDSSFVLVLDGGNAAGFSA